MDANTSGFDCVEFMFSSNIGEEVKPLRKIASGGEISRVMLALKRHLALADQTPVLVFDEIDANIGGRMGRIIGEKLKMVSQSHQVICITHLPQIASYADQHLKVDKFAKNDKTFVNIEELSTKTRLEEIAEMIRGTEKTNITRKQAKEMIDDAKKYLKQNIS
jgi:DNA repair protein RecN (Recombination protein N)